MKKERRALDSVMRCITIMLRVYYNLVNVCAAIGIHKGRCPLKAAAPSQVPEVAD